MDDPVKVVMAKYEKADRHNARIDALHRVINQINLLLLGIHHFDSLTDGTPYAVPFTLGPYAKSLDAMRFNCSQALGQMKPMTDEGFERELKAAQEKVAEMRRELEAKQDLEKEYLASI